MNRCFNCGYMWADYDDEGRPITNEYCHYEGPDAWAPCEQDDAYDYEEERAEVEAEVEAYEEWLEAQTEREWEAASDGFYGEPYDYQEF